MLLCTSLSHLILAIILALPIAFPLLFQIIMYPLPNIYVSFTPRFVYLLLSFLLLHLPIRLSNLIGNIRFSLLLFFSCIYTFKNTFSCLLPYRQFAFYFLIFPPAFQAFSNPVIFIQSIFILPMKFKLYRLCVMVENKANKTKILVAAVMKQSTSLREKIVYIRDVYKALAHRE